MGAALVALLASAVVEASAADINLNFYPVSGRTLDDEPWDRQRNQLATMCATVGLYWRLGPHFNLGFYGRVLTSADLELFGEPASANYWQYGPLLGWSWPARRPEPLTGVE